MDRPVATEELLVRANVGRHLAFAPVAFAVTEGPSHTLLYANAVFLALQSAGKISLDPLAARSESSALLTPLLDRVFQSGKTLHDTIVAPADRSLPSWSCTIWPVSGPDDAPEKLVIEVRDVDLIEGALVRQRAIAEQLLLGALHEQDVARDAMGVSNRAEYLAEASRDLSLSLDEAATQDTVRRIALPRPGTWCIVDVVESNGVIRRLAAIHPDPSKQALASALEEQWPSAQTDDIGIVRASRWELPSGVTHDVGDALLRGANGAANMRILHEIGFGALLVVPLIVRARVQGAITFISRPGDPPFSAEEIALAMDLAARCAMALDNARLYREADALRLAAELANQSKGQFLGSMSHELRTPLNAIGGFTELIDLGIHGPVTEAQHVALARIKANQQHLLGLITEILDFVRVESGRMEYHLGEVVMLNAITDVCEMLSSAVEAKGLALTIECDTALVAWADPDRVRQVLLNLVMNAVKYGAAEGGTITLTCAVASEMAILSVTDTGPGIPADRLESIFEPFMQVTAPLAQRRGGVGLGLAISRDLARAMNGDLTAESTLGAGARFTLALPTTKNPGAAR